jgi:hypothetical protein
MGRSSGATRKDTDEAQPSRPARREAAEQLRLAAQAALDLDDLGAAPLINAS